MKVTFKQFIRSTLAIAIIMLAAIFYTEAHAATLTYNGTIVAGIQKSDVHQVSCYRTVGQLDSSGAQVVPDTLFVTVENISTGTPITNWSVNASYHKDGYAISNYDLIANDGLNSGAYNNGYLQRLTAGEGTYNVIVGRSDALYLTRDTDYKLTVSCAQFATTTQPRINTSTYIIKLR